MLVPYPLTQKQYIISYKWMGEPYTDSHSQIIELDKDVTLRCTGIIPNSVGIYRGFDTLAHDDGEGHLIGYINGDIDYTKGTITNIKVMERKHVQFD